MKEDPEITLEKIIIVHVIRNVEGYKYTGYLNVFFVYIHIHIFL